MKTYLLLLLLFGAIMFISCQDEESLPKQDSDNPPQDEQTIRTVKILDNSFSPQNLSISIGDTVVWINNGSMTHTSTSGTGCESDGNWNSGNLSPEETFFYVFKAEGAFDYFCIPHCGLGMTGSITVKE